MTDSHLENANVADREMDQTIAGIGDNLPDDPAQVIRDNLDEAHGPLIERRDALLAAVDRVPEKIDDDETAGKVGDFITQFTAAAKNAEASRVDEKEPHLKAGRTVDAWFKAITEPLNKAKGEINSRLTIYLRKKEAEERRAREEEERRAREQEQRLAREAAEAAETAETELDLEAAVDAEDRAEEAEQAVTVATKAADAKPADLSRTRGDASVSSLRTLWKHDSLDRDTINLESLRQHIPAAALDTAVRKYIEAGGRELTGVRIYETKIAAVA